MFKPQKQVTPGPYKSWDPVTNQTVFNIVSSMINIETSFIKIDLFALPLNRHYYRGFLLIMFVQIRDTNKNQLDLTFCVK